MSKITDFSKKGLENISNTDPYLSSLVTQYYGEELINDGSDNGIESGKITLQEVVDRFKEERDSYYSLEGNEETKFLSQLYILPEGIDENFLWKFRDSKKILNKGGIIDQIIILNPGMEKIILNNDDDKINLLCGIASRFPLDDIKYFIEVLKGTSVNQNQHNKKFMKCLKNTSLWKLCISKDMCSFTIDSYINSLKNYLSEDNYNLVSSFSSFEEYEKWAISDKNIEGLFFLPEVVFSIYFKRDNLNIEEYPGFAYCYLKEYIERNYLTSNESNIIGEGHFGYSISPMNLEKFLQYNKISLNSTD